MKKGKDTQRLVRSLRNSLHQKTSETQRLRRAQEMDRRLLSHTTARLHAAEDEISEAKRIVAHSSVLFEQRRLEPAYTFKLSPTQATPRIEVTNDPGTFSRSALGGELADVPLHALLCSVKEEFNGAIHCYARFADVELAYSMTPQVLKVTPKDILVRRIAGELARELVGRLRGC